MLLLLLWTMSLTESSRVNACDREEKYEALCEEFAGEQPHFCADNTAPQGQGLINPESTQTSTYSVTAT